MLVTCLFFEERIVQAARFGSSRCQAIDRSVHRVSRVFNVDDRFRVGKIAGEFFEQWKSGSLRFQHDLCVIGKAFWQIAQVALANQRPSSVDDLFLKLRKFLGLLCVWRAPLLLLLLIGLLPVLLLTLAEYLFEMPYLGEEHVTAGSAKRPLRTEILSPEMVSDQLIRFGLQRLEVQEVARGRFCTPLDTRA